VAQRIGDRDEVYWGGILCHVLNMKGIIQTIAEAVITIKYYFVLYKV
jgi:hypothetical protein